MVWCMSHFVSSIGIISCFKESSKDLRKKAHIVSLCQSIKEEDITGAILASNILHIFILSLMMVDRKEIPD